MSKSWLDNPLAAPIAWLAPTELGVMVMVGSKAKACRMHRAWKRERRRFADVIKADPELGIPFLRRAPRSWGIRLLDIRRGKGPTEAGDAILTARVHVNNGRCATELWVSKSGLALGDNEPAYLSPKNEGRIRRALHEKERQNEQERRLG